MKRIKDLLNWVHSLKEEEQSLSELYFCLGFDTDFISPTISLGFSTR